MAERREQERFGIDAVVHIRSKYYQWYATHTVNITDIGMAIYSPATLPAGHQVSLHIELPTEENKPRICCDATVMHCRLQDDRYLIGLRFDNLPANGAERIRRYCDNIHYTNANTQ